MLSEKQRLNEALVGLDRPSLRGGSRASNRLDYQSNWSLCRLLELHEGSSPYLVVCDWHEDVLVLNSPTDPTAIELYQVKTRRSGGKAYTVADLVKKQGVRKKTSPIGKLAYNCSDFLEYEMRGIFTSNVGFKIAMDAGGDSSDLQKFSLLDLSTAAQDRIVNVIEKELGIVDATGVAGKLEFLKANLSVENHSSHTLGHLVEFIEKLYPGRSYQAGPLYRLIFSEIKRRANYEGDCRSFSDLCSLMGISRNDMDEMLSCVETGVDEGLVWNRLEQRLNSEAVPWHRLEGIRSEWRRYEASLTDTTNLAVFGAQGDVRALLACYRKDHQVTGLESMMEWIVEAVSKQRLPWVVSDDHVRAVALWEVCHEPEELPEAREEFEEEGG
jgi:Cap4, dsDNA endonuclease domain